MADAATCPLDSAHPPKQESVDLFTTLLPEIKKKLLSLKKHYEVHDPVTNTPLEGDSGIVSNLSPSDLKEVRVGRTPYGVHIFGKVVINGEKKAFFVRMFVGKANGEKVEKFHCIFTGEPGQERKLFWPEEKEIEWFDE